MTLDALCAQAVTADKFEIIVVDDGATPPLAFRLRAYEDRLRLQSIRRERVGPSAARNAGARLAASPLLIFLDDDCAPSPYWLGAYLEAYSGTPESALAGPIVNALPNDISSEAYHLIFGYLYSRHVEGGATSAPFVISANFAVSQDLFHSVGGFDERFVLASEDRDVLRRVVAKRESRSSGSGCDLPPLPAVHSEKLRGSAVPVWTRGDDLT